MTYEEYAAIDAVNLSSLLQIARSPQHYQHARRRGGGPETDAMRLGRLAHMAILEPDRYEAETAVWKKQDGIRRGAAFDAWLADTVAAGQKQVSEKEHMQCMAMSVAVREHPVAGSFLGRNGWSEHVLEWTHRASGIACKSRLDWVDADNDVIVDLKTTINATESAFGRSAAQFHYHTQAAFYSDAYRARYGKEPSFVIVVVEKHAPYAVAVYRVPSVVLEAGRSEYERLLMRLKTCLDTGRWPGIMDDAMVELQLPEWAYGSGDGLVWPEDGIEGASV